MGNLTKNLSRDEFECECGCEFDTVDFDLVGALQDVVDHFKALHGEARILITGGNRCKTHNDEVQLQYDPMYVPGSSDSQHIYGKAADFKIQIKVRDKWEYVLPIVVYDYLDSKYPASCGVGLYHNRCHLDVRDYRARWGE